MGSRARSLAIPVLCVFIVIVFGAFMAFNNTGATANEPQVSETGKSIVDERYKTGFNQAIQEHSNAGSMHVYSEDATNQMIQNEFIINLAQTAGIFSFVFVFGLLGIYLWYKSRKTPP